MNNSNNIKFFIKTFGCQMNKDDSNAIEKVFFRHNFIPTKDMEDANIIHINTCCVRQKAEDKFFSLLGEIGKLKSIKRNLVVGVSGCIVENENIFDKAPFIDYIFGAKKSEEYGELMENVLEKRLPRPNNPPYIPHLIKRGGEVSKFSTYFTVVRGCSNFCSYCVVPYVRGNEKSVPFDKIIAEIKDYPRNGCKEIVFLGQNILTYGRDFGEENGLLKLLKETDFSGFKRIQFITSHPKDVTQNFIKEISLLKNLCHYIHIPIQSGDDKILKLMNRKYNIEHYNKIISTIREFIPDASITTDIITGFPGEGDSEFKRTIKLLENTRFDNIYAFKYSPRYGTIAFNYGDPIPIEVKKKRLSEIIELQNIISEEINKKCIGNIEDIIIEEQKGNKTFGRTKTNKVVIIDNLEPKIGDIIKVKIIDGFSHSLKGEKFPLLPSLVKGD